MTKRVFFNDLVSLIWDENQERLDMLDSDGEFIDYFFYAEDLDESETVEEKTQWVIDKIKDMNEEELSWFVYETFDMWYIFPHKTLGEIDELKDKYGEDFVVRIGATAIVVK